jgi:Domain of unknown function (DUF4412)
MRYFLTAFVLLFCGGFASAQSFEGVIEFKKQTGDKSINYVYYVKGTKVRIDEFTSGSRIVSGSFILDTKDSSMIFLNHDRKIWGTRKPKPGSAAAAGAKAMATKNTKELYGYKCVEHIVKNEKDSTQISYWIASGKFSFFRPMMSLLNRQENFSTYYFAITAKDGAMPLLAIEKDLNGNEKGRLEVTRLESKVISVGLFEIPKDFTELK